VVNLQRANGIDHASNQVGMNLRMSKPVVEFHFFSGLNASAEGIMSGRFMPF